MPCMMHGGVTGAMRLRAAWGRNKRAGWLRVRRGDPCCRCGCRTIPRSVPYTYEGQTGARVLHLPQWPAAWARQVPVYVIETREAISARNATRYVAGGPRVCTCGSCSEVGDDAAMMRCG